MTYISRASADMSPWHALAPAEHACAACGASHTEAAPPQTASLSLIPTYSPPAPPPLIGAQMRGSQTARRRRSAAQCQPGNAPKRNG